MIRRRRGTPPAGVTPDGVDGETRSAPGEVRLLLEQWRRQIVDEKFAAKQRRLLKSEFHPASLDEIRVVTRIGRVRLLRKR